MDILASIEVMTDLLSEKINWPWTEWLQVPVTTTLRGRTNPLPSPCSVAVNMYIDIIPFLNLNQRHWPVLPIFAGLESGKKSLPTVFCKDGKVLAWSRSGRCLSTSPECKSDEAEGQQLSDVGYRVVIVSYRGKAAALQVCQQY